MVGDRLVHIPNTSLRRIRVYIDMTRSVHNKHSGMRWTLTDWGHMTQNLSPINTYPVERRMWESVATHISVHHQCNDNHRQTYILFQLSFCVKNVVMPANLISWGKAPVNPNVSGNQAVLDLFPNLLSKNLCPKIICLASASPLGILVSFSTQDPPIGWNSPDLILALTRAKRGG